MCVLLVSSPSLSSCISKWAESACVTMRLYTMTKMSLKMPVSDTFIFQALGWLLSHIYVYDVSLNIWMLDLTEGVAHILCQGLHIRLSFFLSNSFGNHYGPGRQRFGDLSAAYWEASWGIFGYWNAHFRVALTAVGWSTLPKIVGIRIPDTVTKQLYWFI